MNASALPRWRRSVAARFACIALAMLAALVVQAWMLDAGLPLRLGVLVAVALVVVLAMYLLPPSPSLAGGEGGLSSGVSREPPSARPRASGRAGTRSGAGEREAFATATPEKHSRPQCSPPHPAPLPRLPRRGNPEASGLNLLDAFTHAALLAALWPPTVATWPAAIALALALVAQRLLGGWAVNPFPPALLALAIAVALARGISGADFTPPLVSLFDAALVAAVWLGVGVVLMLLRLWPARAPLAFALPVALVCGSGGVPATGFVVAAIVAGFALADTRHLPATRAGQMIVGALAGLGTAALWLDGAPPVAIACPTLLACALTPWIEHLTLARPMSAG